MAKKKSDDNKSLRELLDEFEQIVQWFDGGDLDVEAATAKFEQGSALAEQIKTRLAEAKNNVKVIRQKFDADFDGSGSADDGDSAANNDLINDDDGS
ncbi:MAG: exodeoxyribonuclease VII small subunit [Candidatus Nomurabacteria bacterium]|nr:exodeoxyribonuclease VII small subunit [Candidatus Nomurabacteria bacterium]